MLHLIGIAILIYFFIHYPITLIFFGIFIFVCFCNAFSLEKKQSKEKNYFKEQNLIKEKEIRSKGLRPIQVNLNLKNKEVCFYMKQADLYSPHNVVIKKGHYNSVGIPLGHGFRTSVGTYTQDQKQIQFKKDASGKLYITNQRIIFIENNSVKSLKIEDIIQYEPYLDGVKFYSGNHVYFFITGDIGATTVYSMLIELGK